MSKPRPNHLTHVPAIWVWQWSNHSANNYELCISARALCIRLQPHVYDSMLVIHTMFCLSCFRSTTQDICYVTYHHAANPMVSTTPDMIQHMSQYAQAYANINSIQPTALFIASYASKPRTQLCGFFHAQRTTAVLGELVGASTRETRSASEQPAANDHSHATPTRMSTPAQGGGGQMLVPFSVTSLNPRPPLES